ncbi:flavin-containing monooxygenase [Zhongshania sp.]|uniref:flavin-containing monooxygenase n=1 Tax=Zhongshania sp. TaxID=1971902 RepID=UPI00356AFB77
MNISDELFSASDAEIDDAIKYSSPMVLRGLLYQLTGDTDVFAMPPGTSTKFGTGKEMANEADADLIKAKAAAYLKKLRDSGADEIDIGPEGRLHKSLSLTAGHDIPEHELHIWQEEAAFDRWARGVRWKGGKPPRGAGNFKVAVIGTGITGLNVAVQLKRAGIPFVVIEKNPEVGGSWYENRYPGARVDTSSRGYTHLFSYDYPYKHSYCPRDENLEYFKWVADNFSVREDIQFNTEVVSMDWGDESGIWTLKAQGPSGPRVFEVNAVISCVGFLSRPQLPDIEGMDSFAGDAFHTATWPEGVEIKGKRVAVIGSGASGYQTTPVIAESAAHTFLFQRKPNWCIEDETYVKKLPPQALWLDRNFPFYSNYVRFRIGALINPDTSKPAIMVDPDFDDPHTLSPLNKATRDMCVGFIKRKLASRPDLIEKMTPNFPPMASRPIRVDSDNSLFDALLRDNVSLVTDSIEKITPTGIVAGGVEHELDVITFATGFKANDYLWPMEVRGRGGLRIEDAWAKDGPRGYLGAMVPEFPNLFMCYGPNSNNFGGFTVVDLLELVAQFSLRCIAGLIENNQSRVEVSHDGYWRFASILDEMESKMIYMDPRANNYYQHGGRSCVNGPIDIRRMWRWLNDPAGTPPAENDAGLRPYFGEDLLAR